MALDVIDISAEGLPAYVVAESRTERARQELEAAVLPYGWRQIEQAGFNGM
jgi:hypothetical protein